MIAHFILLSLLASWVQGQCQNSIIVGNINVNDGMGASYIAESGGTKAGGVRISGSSVSVDHNQRIYIAGTCSDSFNPNVFKGYKLLDATLSFTADLSNVGCGCNAALYLSNMPAYNQQNQPDPTKCGDYYCDANNVCGEWCPEMDIFEANNRALQVTPHKCDPRQGKWYPHCDGAGCGINTYRMNPNAFGYGANYIINTQNPFMVSMHFGTTNNQLSRIVTTLTQNGKTFSFTHDDSRCGGGYLGSMTDAFREGMVVIISYWGTTGSVMSWLDVPPCDINQSCNVNTAVVFSNISIQNGTLVSF